MIGYALLLLRALIIAEEEQLVLDDGAADRSAKLLPRRWRERNSGLVREWVARLLVAIAVIVETASMKFIGPGLDGHLHRSRRRLPGLRVVVLQSNLRFRNGV